MSEESASRPRDLSVRAAAQLIEAGRLSPAELAADLIQVVNQLEPEVHAWAFLDRETVHRSAVLAEQVQSGPLRGIPIGIKDNCLTAGMPTEAGSAALRGHIPTSDARVVELLRHAGAYVMGKTVCTEFAMADPPLTRNPWNLAHTPGGSSSGSGAAVAARMVPAAIGTQTGGSLLRPAAYNGIVAVKPTYGRVSREGIIPVAWSLDTVGPMTRSIADADFVLSVIANAEDPIESQSKYRSCLGKVGAPSIGLVSTYFLEECDRDVSKNVEAIVARLSSAGATVERIRTPVDFKRARFIQMIIDHAESAAYHRPQFRKDAAHYGPNVSQAILTGAAIPAVDYLDAQRVRSRIYKQLLLLVGEFDVLMTPTTPASAPRGLTSTGDPSFQSSWTLVGFPAVTVPSGLAENGLPLGIQLVARPFEDERLLAVAEWCERVIDVALEAPILSTLP